MRLELSRPHQLPLSALRQRIESRAAYYSARYPQFHLEEHYEWRGETQVRASYRGGQGQLTLHDGSLQVELELPFFARLYRDRIEAFVQRELAEVTGGPTP